MKPAFTFLLGLTAGSLAAFWLAQSYFFQAGELRLIPSLQLADGGVYAGKTDPDGQLTGQGRIDWANGGYYQGEFRHGQFDGQGTYFWPPGFLAVGNFRQGLLFGKGHVEFADGTRYVGDFEHDLMHGHGKIIYSNGDSWEGEFDNDQLTGSGTWREVSGTIYKGEMVAGEFHGLGEISYADNSRYVGQFRQGKRHGQGVFTDNDGIRYDGDFVDDEFTGSGSITWQEPQAEYVGDVSDWEPHGKGITTANDRQMIGNYKQGRLHGEGEYRGPNGRNYQGNFEEGQYSGQGIWVDGAGNRYEGEFKYNQFHGAGRYTHAEPVDGVTSFTGVWEWGRLVSGDDQVVIQHPEQISEYFLYRQSDRLETSLAALNPGNPDKVELYVLALGTYGDEEVFNREINYIEQEFKVNYHVEGRGLFFSNSRRHIDHRPLATVTSLRRGIDAIAAAMDRDQDILFLYLTTHGSADHVLSFDQSGMDLPDLSADELGQVLDDSGIKWKVVVLSACYSGGFIDRLKNNHTLIFTAAAADKTSFGCDDNTEFTYFGDAFFRQALPDSGSFSAAFDHAVELIEQWEREEDLEPSSPQSHQPKPILTQLRRWRAEKIE